MTRCLRLMAGPLLKQIFYGKFYLGIQLPLDKKKANQTLNIKWTKKIFKIFFKIPEFSKQKQQNIFSLQSSYFKLECT